MTSDEVLEYCLAKPGAWRDEPWDDDVVAKVDQKIFAFLGEKSVGLKCGDDRNEADIWLHRYPDHAKVMAYIGSHGWNSLAIVGPIPEREIKEAIDDSYLTVVGKLPRRRRPNGWDVRDDPA